ncbi:MAG TPA: hypothetical protein VK388_15860 [Pyrinomonadaceae bacterium]|nr:hypothetical protein [Pyrinomonadaceae bacterium]
MNESQTTRRKRKLRNVAARIAGLRREPSGQQYNFGGRIKGRPFVAALFIALIAMPFALFPAQAQSPTSQPQATLTKEEALTALNGLLGDSVVPVEMNQIKGLSKSEFSTWLKRSVFPRASQTALRKKLQPVLSARRFQALVLNGVKLKSSDKMSRVVVVAVDPAIRRKLDTGVFIIYENATGLVDTTNDRIEFCRYDTCVFCPGDQCYCQNVTRNKAEGENCPSSNCDACNKAGGGGKGGTIFDILTPLLP